MNMHLYFLCMKRNCSLGNVETIVLFGDHIFGPSRQRADNRIMVPLLGQAAAAGGGALLSSTHHCSLKSAHPIPPLFSKRRPNLSICPRIEPLTLANAADTSGVASTKPTTSTVAFDDEASTSNSMLFVGHDSIPLEGVIQFEKPNTNSILAKWGLVAVLAGGDVAALLLFAAIGRFSHGFSVFDLATFKTADPFIAGWFLSAYFLGGYAEEGKGNNGLWRAVAAATKSWSLGIPLGIMIRALSIGHTPQTNFVLFTMGTSGLLLIGWRALLLTIFPTDKINKNDIYKRGSLFELFELLTSLARRW